MSAFGDEAEVRFRHVKNLLNGEERPEADVRHHAEPYLTLPWTGTFGRTADDILLWPLKYEGQQFERSLTDGGFNIGDGTYTDLPVLPQRCPIRVGVFADYAPLTPIPG